MQQLLSILKRTALTFLKAAFAASDDLVKVTIKRRLVLLFLLPWFLIFQTLTWLCLQLDDLFFKDFQKVEIKNPVFILGPTRSATTFLYRLLAEDKNHFSCMLFWEILFAPSIVQKKFWLFLGKIDQKMGAPFYRVLKRVDALIFKKINPIHRTSLFLPEEDGFLLLHNFSSLYISLAFPQNDYFLKYGTFDVAFSKKHKNQVMLFYKQCLQRHLYVFGEGRIMLSKSPVFSSKTQTILSFFPDARMLFMQRELHRVIPSSLSFFFFLSNEFAWLPSKKAIYPHTRKFLDFWLTHTLEVKKAKPEAFIKIIPFSAITQKPKQQITELYKDLGLPLSSSFKQKLEQKQVQSQKYKSQHTYSLEEFGLTERALDKIKATY